MTTQSLEISRDAYARMKLAVSTVAWDGHSFEATLLSMARLGITRIEWAFIDGYMDPFTDDDLSIERAVYLRTRMDELGQSCPVLSAHIDGGLADSAARLETRLRFAHGLGAHRLITNAADRQHRNRFYRNLERILPLARKLGVVICFENPGNASDHLINCADDLGDFQTALDHEVFGINYDAGNLVSHRPNVDPEIDLIAALQHCNYLHLKAVQRSPYGYEFGVPGEMGPDYTTALTLIAKRKLPFSLELPFRLNRDIAGMPQRAKQPIDMDVIENLMSQALNWVAAHYPGQDFFTSNKGALHDPA